jgi:hypothetical protein
MDYFKINQQFILEREQFFKTNKFIILEEASKEQLTKIARDKNLLKHLVTIYPNYGYISYFDNNYKILLMCSKLKFDEITQYLKKKYDKDLKISEMADPSTNFKTKINIFISRQIVT